MNFRTCSRISTYRAGLLAVLAVLLAGAPVTPAFSQDAVEDPWKPLNQHIFRFNQTFDDWIMRPVAVSYRAVTPPPLQQGVSNFFSNLDDVTVMFNNALQGKPRAAASDAGRVLLNTTFGIGGLWDVAKHVDLKKHDEDFGQTLAVWGVGRGPYFIMPFVGPSTLRDTFGFGVDIAATPVSSPDEPAVRNSLHALRLIDTRVRALELDDLIYGDAYIFMREAYLQRREYDVHDGNPPKQENPDDPWSQWD